MSGLIPFVKGQSGNPEGKKPGTLNSKTIITKLLAVDVDAQNLTGDTVNVTAHEAIWLKTLQLAMLGDEKARRDIYDRLEGKPLQKVETETKDVVEFASEADIDAELSKHGIDPDIIE